MHDRTIYLEQSCLQWRVCVTAVPAGTDYVVVILGGCAPHIGSVSTAFCENDDCSCHTFLKSGHRDDVISQKFAKELAAATGSSVCVTCGIHYDNLSPSGLKAVLQCADQLLARLLERLREQQYES